MSVIPIPPARLLPSEVQIIQARAILADPGRHADSPGLFRLAWATLKARRGETMHQHRLRARYLIEGHQGGEAA